MLSARAGRHHHHHHHHHRLAVIASMSGGARTDMHIDGLGRNVGRRLSDRCLCWVSVVSVGVIDLTAVRPLTVLDLRSGIAAHRARRS